MAKGVSVSGNYLKTFASLIVFTALAPSSGLMSCASKESVKGPAVEVTDLAPNNGYNYSSSRVVIYGKGLDMVHESSEREPPDRYVPKKVPDGEIQLEMWEGSSERLGRGFALRNVEVIGPKQVSATVPAGVYPGKYSLVLRRGRAMIFTDQRFLVLQRTRNTGPPRIARLTPKKVRAERPARITIAGANLVDTITILAVGPAPPPGSPFTALKDYGFHFGWPIFTKGKHELTDIRNENAARISASVPPDLPPGEYMVQIQTATHRGHQPEAEKTFVVEPQPLEISEAAINFAIFFGVLGLVFVVGLIMAWRQGDVGLRGKRRVLNLCWMVGGLVFYLVLIGSLQFVFSWLS
jgi:hypothetical protein